MVKFRNSWLHVLLHSSCFQGQTVHVHERHLHTLHVHVHSVHVQTRKLFSGYSQFCIIQTRSIISDGRYIFCFDILLKSSTFTLSANAKVFSFSSSAAFKDFASGQKKILTPGVSGRVQNKSLFQSPKIKMPRIEIGFIYYEMMCHELLCLEKTLLW